jgi:transketolase N-terminal domain/subunit
MDWEPKSYDKKWMKGTLNKIKIGGIWGTSFGTYRRTGEKEMTMINDFGDIQLVGMTEELRKEYQEKTKKAIESIGWEYKVEFENKGGK